MKLPPLRWDPTDAILFFYYVTMSLHIGVDLYDGPKERLKYFTGSIATLRPRILAKLSTSFTSPTGTISDLDKLIFKLKEMRRFMMVIQI